MSSMSVCSILSSIPNLFPLLAVIQDRKDIENALRFLIKDLTITGKNGIYLCQEGKWMHIRWAVVGESAVEEERMG